MDNDSIKRWEFCCVAYVLITKDKPMSYNELLAKVKEINSLPRTRKETKIIIDYAINRLIDNKLVKHDIGDDDDYFTASNDLDIVFS